MKKGILCILLSIVLLTPLFTACQSEDDLTGEAASVYTLYTIVDESTTDEAINQVELALNRIMFYRLNVIVKLEMVTEDEYEALIEQKFAEVEEYEANKKNNKSSSPNTGTGLTGDEILKLLEEGEEIPLDTPSIDIFLVRGYENYAKLAEEGKLTAITEKLENEGKALKSSIHSTLFNAAKIGGKIYGVPVNNAIGEYTYLTFDKELLDKYSIDPKTIETVEDLQDYLELIKANEPDVIPLKDVTESASISHLITEGFPALVTNEGNVIDAYSNKALQQYFAMIARYQALGYLAGEDAGEDARYAVRIECGTTEDIDARLEDTGYEYAYNLYANPIAINENTINNIFCVSKYVVSNDLTAVIDILTAINTDEQLMNLLTYGVENEHYVLTDKGQVERLNEDYMVNPDHIGNSFITYTIDGESLNKWDNAIQQNRDAVASPSLGYTVSLTKFKYTDGENGEVEVYEPDYTSIINSVVDKYYPALMDGTAVKFDYNKLVADATAEVETEIKAELEVHYVNNILMPMLNEQVRDDVTTTRGPEILTTATTSINTEYLKKVKSNLVKKWTTQFTKENPDATEDEIDAMVEAKVTDDFVAASLNDYYTAEEIETKISEVYANLLEKEIAAAAKNIVGTPEYDALYAQLMSSEGYTTDLNERLEYDAPSRIQNKVDEKIVVSINEYTAKMNEEIESELSTAIEAFIAEYSEKVGKDREEMLLAMGYLEEVEEGAVTEDGESTDGETSEGETSEGETSDSTSSEAETSEESADESTEADASGDASNAEGEEGEEEEEIVMIKVEKYDSWWQFVLEEKFANSYYTLFPKAE